MKEVRTFVLAEMNVLVNFPTFMLTEVNVLVNLYSIIIPFDFR